ncbi:hypothetical protein ACSBR2_012323 [Camellia fascicularis]
MQYNSVLEIFFLGIQRFCSSTRTISSLRAAIAASRNQGHSSQDSENQPTAAKAIMIRQSSHNSQGHSSQGGENQPAAAKATVGHSDKAEQPQQPVATKATTVKAIAANCNQGHREDLLAIEADQPFKFPATFTFVVRAFSVLDGIGKGLDPHFNITEIAKPIHMAPFNDEYLYVEIANEVTLKFYGLGLGDVTATKNGFGFSTSVADSGS